MVQYSTCSLDVGSLSDGGSNVLQPLCASAAAMPHGAQIVANRTEEVAAASAHTCRPPTFPDLQPRATGASMTSAMVGGVHKKNDLE